MRPVQQITPSPWPHLWAVALACATFPLLWVGGLVTTTDAGMAVPDWPTTYGYNLFLYPWSAWLAGPWDLFVEHGHRLLGAVVGLMTIGLLIVLWRSEERRWLRWVGVAALALVIFQGVLGGMRVRLDERTLAMLHGVTGPLFFACTMAIAVFTSSRWRLSPSRSEPAGSSRRDRSGGSSRRDKPGGSPSFIAGLAVATCILIYLQIVLGAVLRHVPVAAEPATFVHAVRSHLFLAAVLTLHITLLTWLVVRHARGVRPLGGLAAALAGLLLVQLTLGSATWVLKFAAPSWAPTWVAAGGAAIQDGGWLQTHVITAHVAVGSLLLAASLALALHAVRLLPSRTDNLVRRYAGDGQDCPSYAVRAATADRVEAAV